MEHGLGRRRPHEANAGRGVVPIDARIGPPALRSMGECPGPGGIIPKGTAHGPS